MSVRLRVSAVYIPGKGIAEATWEDVETGEKVDIEFPVTKKQGETLSNIVWPCTYQEAQTELTRLRDMLPQPVDGLPTEPGWYRVDVSWGEIVGTRTMFLEVSEVGDVFGLGDSMFNVRDEMFSNWVGPYDLTPPEVE
jgi:hypothetical protein